MNRKDYHKRERFSPMIINKNKCVQITCSRLRGLHVSSIVNESIRAILNVFLFFFFTRRFHTHEKHKTHTSKEKQKRQYFYAHKDIWKEENRLFNVLCFLCLIKASKRKKIACLTFCAFYAHKKHLKGRKSLVCVLCFLCS